MSEGSDRGGWWQASDGRWYPPELHTDARSAAADATPGPAGLLATDADREAATVKLADGLASGQLTLEDHEERTGAALQARSVEELAALTGDLDRMPVPPDRRARVGVIAACVVA